MTDAVHEWPLGDRVRQARGKESHRSLAKRAGVSAELVWQLENGRRRSDDAPFSPKASTVEQVARALDIPVSEALVLAGYKPEHHMSAEPFENALARKLGQLTPEQQRAFEILVDSLLVAGGHVGARPVGVPDVMVKSAGEEVRADVQSQGESVTGAAGSRQPQGD